MNIFKKNLGILSEQLDGKMHWNFGELEKKVFEFSDQQLDGKMHWMFMNEPRFQMYFVECALYHLRNDYWTNGVTNENIFASIGKAANIIDSDLSAEISPMDKVMIQATFDTFVVNGFKNAENHPWTILPSENPDYKYDWILWNDDYPIVQYSSKTKQIDPCLEFSLKNFNTIVESIHQASRDSAVPDAMCVSEYNPKVNQNMYYEAEDMLGRHGIDVSNAQGNGDLMSVHLLAHELNNEVFKHISKRIDFKRGDGKDLINEAENARFLMDADSFCREQIRKDNSLLEYPLEQLLREAKEIVNVFKNGVAEAKEDFIKILPLEVSLNGFHTSLDCFANEDPSKCGPWEIFWLSPSMDIQICYEDRPVIQSYKNDLNSKGGFLQREACISDKSFSEICDMVHSDFPQFVMAPFEQEKINTNKQSQGIK